jgi:hypothetical protein
LREPIRDPSAGLAGATDNKKCHALSTTRTGARLNGSDARPHARASQEGGT